jgi:MoxR-like ATPase
MHDDIRSAEPFTEPPPTQQNWWIYRGLGRVIDPDERTRRWPFTPPWRSFNGAPDLVAPEEDQHEVQRRLGRFLPARMTDREVIERVNTAITVCRPLIVTGRPGSGKSSLAYAIARELGLGRVLRWLVTSRTTLKSGLYDYDALGRAQAITTHENHDIGNFVHLGPLGTALLPYGLPRVLLIEGMDTSDFDLPADLSRVFEEGGFLIPELVRVRDREPEVVVHTADPGRTASVAGGIVRCHAFPLVIITSDGERDFPSAFTRQCVRLSLPDPDVERLGEFVAAHFSHNDVELPAKLINTAAELCAKDDSVTVADFLGTVHTFRCGATDTAPETMLRRLSDRT